MKARPERMRFTFFDDASRGIPIDLPAQRHWAAGVILGVFFVAFASVEVAMIARAASHRMRDVFDLMMLLFDVFWLLGWSVGVVVLGGLTALFLFHRESARLEPGRLVHVPRLGPLKVVCEYELAKVGNVRLEDAKDGERARVRFDYGGRSAGLGDAMAREDAQRVMEKLRNALPARERKTGAEAVERPAQPAASHGKGKVAPRPSGEAEETGWLTPSAAALLAANLFPFGGVVFFGWDLGHVMVLYWAESAIIGFYTVFKLCVVAKLAAAALVPFFVGHFGGFMAAHFAFLHVFFLRRPDAASGPGPLADLLEIFTPVWPALLALAISHGVSFALNFIGRREYAGASASGLMTAPYRRVIVMHVTIIFGGGLVMLFDTPAAALALLVALKTAVDWRAHRREHARAPGAPSP